MPERKRRRTRENDIIRDIQLAGNEVHLKGKYWCLAVPKDRPVTRDTVSFVFLRRETKGRSGNPGRGLRKTQIKTITILEALGLKVVKL